MSQRFLNDHSVKKVQISKILRITAGKFHCWCDSNAGIIKKPNNAVPDFLWNKFEGIKPKEFSIPEVFKKEIIRSAEKREIVRESLGVPIQLKWYQRLWNWIIKKLPGNIASGVKSR